VQSTPHTLATLPGPPPPLGVQELDFEQEAANAAQCAANFRGSRLGGSVVVPRVYPGLSSRRVLTMEWMEGVPVGNTEAQRAMRLRSHDVAELVSGAAQRASCPAQSCP